MLAQFFREGLYRANGFYGKYQLQRRFPALHGLLNEKVAEQSAIPSAYRHYVQNISPENAAISERSALFLFALCLARRPKSILDMGSGISSYVFRHYSSLNDNSCEVVSVDQDPRWLSQTRTLCLENNLIEGEFVEWPDFMIRPRSFFDLVFFDLTSQMDVRFIYLKHLDKFLSPSSLLVLDDCNYIEYWGHVKRWMKEADMDHISLRHYTLDRFKRFMILAMKSNHNGRLAQSSGNA